MAYAIVCRFKTLQPSELGKVRMHAQRRGGDLSHIDHERTPQNRVLIGDEDWVEIVRSEIEIASRKNLLEETSAKRARSDKKGAVRRERQGELDPWKPGRKNPPIYEGILTANAEHFRDAGFPDFDVWDDQKVAAFERVAVDMLECEFGADAVPYARLDLDEKAPNLHFIVTPWVEKKSKSRGTQRLLQPSAYRMLQSYETGQDIAGEAFGEVGLVRGDRRAARQREDVEEGREPEPDPVWTHPLDKRREEADRARQEREKTEKERATSEAAEKRASEDRAQAQRDREAAEARLAEATRRERAAAAAQAKADRDAERQRKRDAELAERERAANEKDRQLEARAAELTCREKILRDAARRWSDMHDAIKSAAEKVGLLENPVIAHGLAAAREVRSMLGGGRRGREKTRGD